MLNVFALLTSPDGEIEQINLGSLYVKQDEDGYIREIEVEPYDADETAQYEPYFNKIDPEIPEVPQRVNLNPRCPSIQGFAQSEGWQVDFDEIEDEPDQTRLRKANVGFEDAFKAAYRLLERVVRSEPVLVGFSDFREHETLSVNALLQVTPPTSNISIRARHRPLRTRQRDRSVEADRHLCRVILKSTASSPGESPSEIVLYLYTRPDGFPHRAGPISGLADARWPLIILENGDLRVGDGSRFFTNLMANKIAVGAVIGTWTDYCRRCRPFRVTQVERFVAAKSAEA